MTLGKKSVAVAGLLATIGAGALSAGTVFAAEKSTPHDRMEALVSAIATKFNLSTTDVQAVFDAQHAENVADRVADMKQHAIDRLAKAVATGKLTQTQADAIAAKAETMKTFVESLKTMTKDQRQAALKTQHDVLVQWAKDNGIPKEFMQFDHVGGPGEHRIKARHERMEE